MKSVWVPVDFSATSLNAAEYAVRLFTGVYGIQLTLFHMYEKPEHRATAEEWLQRLQTSLWDKGIVKMSTVAEEGADFEKCFERVTKERPPELVVMGISGRDKLGQALIGSNTLKLAHKKICPVLIVPPGARFVQWKNLGLTTDFSALPSAASAGLIKFLLSTFFAKLHVINVNPEMHVSLTDQQQQMKSDWQQAFQGFENAFHFLDLFDLQQAIDLLVADHAIEVILTTPQEHSWLETLTTGTHTRKLAYQSEVPVLTLPA